MRRIAPLLLAACLCQGCFVLEEIDKGQAIMDQHSPRRRAQEQEQEPSATGRSPGGDEGEGLVAGVRGWWKRAREPKPVERDPSDVPVRCQVGGSVQFLRTSDCAIRGGRVL